MPFLQIQGSEVGKGCGSSDSLSTIISDVIPHRFKEVRLDKVVEAAIASNTVNSGRWAADRLNPSMIGAVICPVARLKPRSTVSIVGGF
jgi:hypothetical protein